MNIALIIGEVGFISRRKIIEGIVHNTQKEHINTFLFTSEGWHVGENNDYSEGEFNIYNLPELSEYDGVIVDIDSIHEPYTQATIVKKLEESNIPIVSINIPLNCPNSAVIKFENVLGIKNIVEHLAAVHNVDSFHYISGPQNNYEANIRKDAFCQAANEQGIPCTEENISYGNFKFHSGQAIIAKMLEEGKQIPGAIVAANDEMAIGAMLELIENGYKIPDDVIVTGYDDSEYARCLHPRLTTVSREEVVAGKKAVELLISLIKGKNKGKTVEICSKNIISESCGCPADTKRHKSQVIMELAEDRIITASNLEAIKALTISLSNMKTFSEFSMQLQMTVEQMDLDYFYLCICGTREDYFEEIDLLASGKDIARDITQYTEYGTIPFAYENGKWNSYPEFKISSILPKRCLINKDGDYHIIMPVHYGNICIGYCVLSNKTPGLDKRILQHLVLGINNGLGAIREHDIMSTMLSRINDNWLYDELTGLYNRAGFWKKTDGFINDVQNAGKKIVVYFIDLDGLKGINDKFGHEEGDRYIKSMADILMETKNNIVARYGGDEYIVLSSYDTIDDILNFITEINDKIAEYNDTDAKHKLSASIGYEMDHGSEEIDIRKMIANADKEMYIAKRIKKGQ